MKRRLFLIIFGLIVLLGFAATTDMAMTAGLKWYLQHYAHSHFDADLVYDSFTKNGGGWIIDKPRLVKANRDIFRADKLTIDLGASPLQRSIDIDVNLQAPTFALGDHYNKAIKMAEKSSHRFHLIRFTQHIVATNGCFNFPSNDKVTPLMFTVDAVIGPQSHGTARIVPIYSKHPESELVATLSQKKNQPLHLDISIGQMPLAPVAELMRMYYYEAPAIAIQSGDVSGELHIEFPKKQLTEAEGKILVKNLSGNHIDKDFLFEAPEISLTLISQGHEESFVPTAGYVNIEGGAKFILTKDEEPFWSFEGLEGSFAFKNNEGGDFHLDGFSNNKENSRPLHLEGYLDISHANETNLNFKTGLKKPDSHYGDMTTHVSLRHLAEQWALGEIEINGFTHEEFSLFQHLIGKKYPRWNDIHLNSGVFDTSVIVYFNDLQPSEIKFEKIQARNASFLIDNWELTASATSASGTASMDLTISEPITSLNADLTITDGTASLPSPRGNSWNFIDIDTHLSVRKGIIQQTALQGSMAGMHAKITLDGTDPNSLIKMMLVGSTDDLAPYMSKNIKKNLEKNFAHNIVRIEAVGKAESSALDVKGVITFADKQKEDSPIHFSFALDRDGHDHAKEKLPHYVVSEYLTSASMEAIASLMPDDTSKKKKKKKKSTVDPSWTLFGYTIQEGRFEANDLALEKYLSPLIFTEDEMAVHGIGAFYGIFNLHGVKVDYDASDLVLKNEDFAIEIKRICQHNDGCAPLFATHYFDLDEGKGYGTMPVSGGSYFEKNSGLLFTDIDALTFIQHDRAHFTALSTYCNGIHFGGNIEVDWSMPGKGIFEVEVHIADMSGKVSNFQHFFSHFKQPFFFVKMPLEGNISLRNKGASLFFAFEPGDFQLDSTIEGSINDGAMSSPGLDMTVNDVNVNFFYDHKKGLLDFSDFHATLLVGSASHFEEYTVASDDLRFTDFKNNETSFDIWVADKSRDVIRIVGKTHEDRGANDEPIIKVDIDKKLSHFGNVYPKNFELVLDTQTSPILLNLDFDFALDELLTDLQRFSRTGLLFLSRSMLKELNGIKRAEGTLTGSINYFQSNSSLEYKIHGNGIKIDDYNMNALELVGNKRGDLWSVEQLQIDNMALSFDVHKDPNLWNINFLGARIGSSILIGMEGIYLPDEDRLKAKINLCEVDLSALHEWPSLAEYVDPELIKGNLRMNGTVNIAFDKSLPDMGHVEIHTTGSLTNAQFETHIFDDIPNLTLEYTSEKGISIKNVQTVLSSSENNEARAGLYLHAAHFKPNHTGMTLHGLYFNIPAQQLGWLSRRLEARYPSFLSPGAIDLIGNIKSSGNVQGHLSASHIGDHKTLRVVLDDDTYHWNNSQYTLRHTIFDYTPQGLKLTAKHLHENTLLNIIATVDGPDYERGMITISEDNGPKSQIASPMTIYWSIVEPDGICISKVKGHLCGISADLANDIEFPLNPHYHHLVGTVSFDMAKAAKLFTPDQVIAIKNAQLGEGYSIHGRYTFEKNSGKPFADRLYFQGELSGSHFTCYGYRMNYMTGQLDYQPNQAVITNMSISDACGQISIPTLSFTANAANKWIVNAPSILFKDFHPSSMESLIPSPTKIRKSLTIKEMEVQNLQGILGDRTTFRGTGKMSFVNPQKKNFQDTIFAIPAELLTRIGLDLGVLTPVRGNVDFEISDAKIHLTKFREVYSKKKVSKFQLTNKGGYPSYIDFDGNIHVQIKMKQYNLVFKLAELFTVTIGGTLSKPTYSLQKQPKGDSNG